MCDCKVGPGKFEGEPALAFILYYDGFPDEQTYAVDFFLGPFDSPSQEAVTAAQDYGYCLSCVLKALSNRSYGASIWESDQGFVYLNTYGTAEKYAAAMADADADDAERDQEDY
jgi:hypothetical protein